MDVQAENGLNRPLESELDLSPMAAPLYWAEGGQALRVCGSRISLEVILTYYRMGYTAEMIAETYPWLDLADIYLVIAFYVRNKRAVHAHLRKSHELADVEWAEMAARGITLEESYRAYCEDRGTEWFNEEC